MLKNHRKKYKYKSSITAFAAVALSLFATSCSNDEPIESNGDGAITFTTPTQIGGPTSRVTYEQLIEGENSSKDTRIKVTWNDGDVVGLIDKKNNVIAKFQATPIKGSIATFKCIEVNGPVDFENVTGTLQYMPKDQDGDGYLQKENKSVAHLVYANNIVAVLQGDNLKNGNDKIEFQNTTAIFRVILNAPRNLANGATLTMYGAKEWGTGISLTLGFPLSSGNELVAYIAAPAGKTGSSLNVALTDGTDENTKEIVTTFTGPSSKQYESGKEYTAKFSSNTTDWDHIVDGENGFVDLDLPSGTLWATKNLGAKNLTGPNSFGGYYAWGSTTPLTSGFDYSNKINGYTCGMKFKELESADIIISEENPVLRPKFDAATHYSDSIKANSVWVTPTKEQWNELLEYSTWAWNSALMGYEVKSNNNNAVIFMPAAGFYSGNNLNNVGHYIYYWTSTAIDAEQNSWGMHISGPHKIIAEQSYPRYEGYNIRPVKNKPASGQSTPDETKTDQTTGK